MKKSIVIFSVVLMFMLHGCSNHLKEQGASADSNMEHATVEKSSHVQAAATEVYMSNPQAPDTISLTEVGDRHRDANGTVTLESITDDAERITVGPVEMTLQDVKVMNFSPAHHLIDYYHGFTYNETNFNIVELHVTVKNTSDERVNFAPVSVLETSAGEMKDFEDEIYLQELLGDLEPKQEKTGLMAFILEETDPKDITSFTITTSDVFGKDKQSLHRGEIINVNF